jgi:hypothetical protein
MNSDPTRKVLLDVGDGPEGITIYTSEDRAVVDFAEQCPALYLSASLNDAHVNLGPFTLLRDHVIAALGRNSQNPPADPAPINSLMQVGSTRHTWLRGWLAASRDLLTLDSAEAVALIEINRALIALKQAEYDLLTESEGLNPIVDGALGK